MKLTQGGEKKAFQSNKANLAQTNFEAFYLLSQGILSREKRRKFNYPLKQWFSTGVPRNPWVPWKALGVPPISELDVYLLVNYSYVCLQIVLQLKKGAANQKRLRTAALDSSDIRFHLDHSREVPYSLQKF